MSTIESGSLSKAAVTVLGGLITTAIIAIAGFSFSTSRSVAVLNENVRVISEKARDNELRIRRVEEEIIRLQARVH